MTKIYEEIWRIRDQLDSQISKHFWALFILVIAIALILTFALGYLDNKIIRLSEQLNSTNENELELKFNPIFSNTIVSIPINLSNAHGEKIRIGAILCNLNDDAYWQIAYDETQESWALQCIEEHGK